MRESVFRAVSMDGDYSRNSAITLARTEIVFVLKRINVDVALQR